MKLCSLCHWLLQRRRWLILPVTLAASAALCLLLPSRLWISCASAALLPGAMLLLYLRDLHQVWQHKHSRMPSPADAQAEIVMIDASLIDLGAQVQAVAQPVNPCSELSMRMGSGALLLGTAMVFHAQDMPPADRDALFHAASRMNIRASTLLSRSPVIDRDEEDGMRRITVQDGTQERSWFTADARTVAAGCSSIWEERIRPMGQHDRDRILDAARYMETGGRRVLAFATATDDERPIFLGLAALGDGMREGALEELQELRAMGLTLTLRDDGLLPVDIDALRRNLDIPDLHARPDLCLCSASPYPDRHCLSIRTESCASLSEPVKELQGHFSCMALMLRQVFRLMGLCLLCAVLAGSPLSLLSVPAVLAAAYLSFGSLTTSRRIRWPSAAIAACGCLLTQLLVTAAAPASAGLAGMTLVTALTAFLSLTLSPLSRTPPLPRLLPMLLTAAAMLVIGLLLSLTALPGALLPAFFALAVAALLGLTCLLLTR